MSPVSAGSSAKSGETEDADRLEFITMNIGGGLCSAHQDCWRQMTVRSQPELVLEDAEGALRFEASMDTLKTKYRECPPWEEPAGFNSAVDPLPQRATCWTCYGKCNGGKAAATATRESAGVPVGGTLARDAGLPPTS